MNILHKLTGRSPVDETALHYIWLSLACGFSSPAARELISAFHGADAVYDASDFSGRTDIAESVRKRLEDKNLDEAREIYKACRRSGTGILTYESDLYPSRLRTITNPPAVLYYKGRLTNLDREPCVAVVGTRSLSEYGAHVTEWFAYEMAKSGAVIVSGLAKGADGTAHRAALKAGGYTVAVLGTAIDKIYPIQNEGLFAAIEDRGLILSEYYPSCRTTAGSFPERNRIISGLCLCTLITEAGMTSGALITARSAVSQNRDLYAVPGNVTSPGSDGTNHLIQSGAECVACPAQVLEKYVPYFPSALRITSSAYTYGSRSPAVGSARQESGRVSDGAGEPPSGLSQGELKVYEFISESGGAVLDEISAALDIPPSQVMPLLSTLEIQEYIKSVEGGKYIVSQ